MSRKKFNFNDGSDPDSGYVNTAQRRFLVYTRHCGDDQVILELAPQWTGS